VHAIFLCNKIQPESHFNATVQQDFRVAEKQQINDDSHDLITTTADYVMLATATIDDDLQNYCNAVE
jgi:hypothetical protein